jgi:tetratricopeptide (TPR) repeat protein
MLQRIKQEEPKAPSKLGKAQPEQKLDPKLDWITMKALAKERTHRFATVNAMGRDLERYLAGEPVDAAPPPQAYRARKFVTKHRFVLVMSATLALVLAGAVVVSTLMAVRARRAEQGATAVSDFLRTDLLAQADPGNQLQANVAPDANLTVRTALDRAAAAVGGRFQQAPLVEAATRQTISDAYRGLGLYPKAEPLLADLLAVRRRLFGENDPDTIQSLGALAHSYRLEGKQEQAIAMFKTAEAASSRVLGPEHRDTVMILESLGKTYFEAASSILPSRLRRRCSRYGAGRWEKHIRTRCGL